MRAMFLLLFAQASFAHFLVHDIKTVTQLRNVKGPIYRDNLLKTEFKNEQFLRPLGPFVKYEGEFLRFYKSFDKCFKMSFERSFRLIKKIRCSKVKEIYLGLKLEDEPDYKRIAQADLKNYLNEEVIDETEDSFVFPALVHSYRQYQEDSDVLGDIFDRLPKVEYEVQVNYSSKLQFINKQYVFVQTIQTKTSKHGTISEREKIISHGFNLDQSNFYFANEMGELIIIPPTRKYLPETFLKLNPDVFGHLENYSNQLYQRDGKGYCFRREWFSNHAFDCQGILENTPARTHYYKLESIKVKQDTYEVSFR
jgi:hypothetical protein